VTVAPRIACSETALNRPLLDAWDLARRCGIEGIEVYGPPDDLQHRLPMLRSAKRRGVVISTVCAGPPFLGRVDADDVGRVIRAVRGSISVTPELEAAGIVLPVATPSSFDATRRILQPYLVDALADLADHAESVATTVLLEPLNRYEDGLINRLEQAVQLCEEVGSASLCVVADCFHMNIEERDVAQAIRAAGARLRHVHVADSNRRQPGAGHLDVPALLDALRSIGFDGWLALECSLDDPIETTLGDSTHALRDAWERLDAAGATNRARGWQDDVPSSSSAAPGSAFASTTER
jgi:sugar phosphate isomerase/epimerase